MAGLRTTLAWAAVLLVLFAALPVPAQAEPLRIRVVGGLAGVAQYTRHEAPFWQERVPRITGGRLRADIAPFDASGIRPNEMLNLMRLGVVGFGTLLLAVAAPDDPELNGADLPALSPDFERLRLHTDAYRPRLAAALGERYDLELLAIYTYPAQVLFCNGAFSALRDMAGRRVRTSSVGQSDIMEALGARPVIMPFAQVVPAVRAGRVDCAITGTLSGFTIGLHEVTTHVHMMAISWGLSAFAAHRPSWEALPAELRETLRAGLRGLEEEIWEAARRDTEQGLQCNAGQPGCAAGRGGRMRTVPVSADDESLRYRLLRDVVLPRWLDRCGPGCADAWNATLAPLTGLELAAP